MSEIDDRTYCVDLVVFVFGIDVFNISHNVCVQSLQKEKCVLVLDAKRQKPD